jgi:Arc/MetJ-type ribon-helix-helix transcriptional regulator
MPEPMRKFVEQRARGGRYGSVSEYIRDLIRRDQNLLRREPAPPEGRRPEMFRIVDRQGIFEK